MSRRDAQERLYEAAQLIEDVGSEIRSGDHQVSDREETADVLMDISHGIRKLRLLIGDDPK